MGIDPDVLVVTTALEAKISALETTVVTLEEELASADPPLVLKLEIGDVLVKANGTRIAITSGVLFGEFAPE